jgi:hypothetical protein
VIQVEIYDTDGSRIVVNFPRPLAALPDERKVEAAKRRGEKRATEILREYVRSNMLSGQVLKKRTGAAHGSIKTRMTDDGGEVYVDDKEAPYLRFHEFGVAKSWTITPKRAKALRFEVNGEVVFARRVTHPGLKVRSFLRRGLREARLPILTAIREEIVKAIQP